MPATDLGIGKINLNEKKVPVLRFNRSKWWAAQDRKRTLSHTNQQHSNEVVIETHQMECKPHGAVILVCYVSGFISCA